MWQQATDGEIKVGNQDDLENQYLPKRNAEIMIF